VSDQTNVVQNAVPHIYLAGVNLACATVDSGINPERFAFLCFMQFKYKKSIFLKWYGWKYHFFFPNDFTHTAG